MMGDNYFPTMDGYIKRSNVINLLNERGHKRAAQLIMMMPLEPIAPIPPTPSLIFENEFIDRANKTAIEAFKKEGGSQ